MSADLRDRFTAPLPAAATPVAFPAIVRDRLANGLSVWTISLRSLPVVTVALAVRAGTAKDPIDRPGLASITSDLMTEGADGRNAIQLAEQMSRLGSHLEMGVGPDMLVAGFTSLSRVWSDALGFLAGVVCRPHLSPEDLPRVRELRLSRLRQLRQSASALAERAFSHAVFGAHGYGHTGLGTTVAVEETTVDDTRAWHVAAVRPDLATLVVAGDVTPAEVNAAVRDAFGGWTAVGSSLPSSDRPIPQPAARLLLVDRPGAPQSEVLVGHVGPRRRVKNYHALLTLNAAFGGQFSSRLNRHLRETKGWTYGAKSAFVMRREAGTFDCESSIQGDATADAVRDMLAMLRDVRGANPIGADELEFAKASLTRGYVRHFETAAQHAHAAAHLAMLELPDDSYDAFVPCVEAVTESDVIDAAVEHLRPDACVAVIVGDAASVSGPLGSLGVAVEPTSVEM